MTVTDLIDRLQAYPANALVHVGVRTFTQAYAVAHVQPFEIDASYSGCTLWVSLPENMHVVTRKK